MTEILLQLAVLIWFGCSAYLAGMCTAETANNPFEGWPERLMAWVIVLLGPFFWIPFVVDWVLKRGRRRRA